MNGLAGREQPRNKQLTTERMRPAFVERVEIRDLYGEISYNLPDGISNPDIWILYGPNGTGKTTILKLIRALVGAERDAGLRTFLASTPFTRASVYLSDGTLVEAERKGDITGHVIWSIRGQGFQAGLPLGLVEGRVHTENFSASQVERYDLMLKFLRARVPKIAYLDDRRTFEDPAVRGRRSSATPGLRRTILRDGLGEDPVTESMRDMMNGLRREALNRSSRGNQSTQAIYSALIDRVFSDPVSITKEAEELLAEVSHRLITEQDRSQILSKYGLIEPIDHSEMVAKFQRYQDPKQLITAATVLQPYLDSLAVRDATLEVLHAAIETWVRAVSEFISPKSVRLRIGDEIQIFSRTGTPLDPSALSSGERHLLMMLTQAFLMRSIGSGMLIIDEPELSLNPVWQRSLISVLTKILGREGPQLIVASHSLEIASQYESNVIELRADDSADD